MRRCADCGSRHIRTSPLQLVLTAGNTWIIFAFCNHVTAEPGYWTDFQACMWWVLGFFGVIETTFAVLLGLAWLTDPVAYYRRRPS